jgi:FkbM family methyltransferase
MNVSTRLYAALLRLPRFRGKGRLEGILREHLFRRPTWAVRHGLRMCLDPVEWSQVELLRDGCLEPITTTLYGEILRDGDAYVDVGAHVGFHSLVARHHVGPSGRVITVEPQPYCGELLLANWRANGFANLVLYLAAAGARDGAATLRHQHLRDASRLSLCLDGVNDETRESVGRLVRLDTVFGEQKLDRVRIVKIDVEGYEPEVLEGLGARLEDVDHLIVEVLGSPDQLSERSWTMLSGLERSGWRLHTVEGKPWAPGGVLPENNVWLSRLPCP